MPFETQLLMCIQAPVEMQDLILHPEGAGFHHVCEVTHGVVRLWGSEISHH